MLHTYTNPHETEAPAKPLAFKAVLPDTPRVIGASLIYCQTCGVPAGIAAMSVYVERVHDQEDLFDEGEPLDCDTCGEPLVTFNHRRGEWEPKGGWAMSRRDTIADEAWRYRVYGGEAGEILDAYTFRDRETAERCLADSLVRRRARGLQVEGWVEHRAAGASRYVKVGGAQ